MLLSNLADKSSIFAKLDVILSLFVSICSKSDEILFTAFSRSPKLLFTDIKFIFL